jgi:hypothetical protein
MPTLTINKKLTACPRCGGPIFLDILADPPERYCLCGFRENPCPNMAALIKERNSIVSYKNLAKYDR